MRLDGRMEFRVNKEVHGLATARARREGTDLSKLLQWWLALYAAGEPIPTPIAGAATEPVDVATLDDWLGPQPMAGSLRGLDA